MAASVCKGVRFEQLSRIFLIRHRYIVFRRSISGSRTDEMDAKSDSTHQTEREETITPYRTGSIFPENLGLNSTAKEQMRRRDLKPSHHPGVMSIGVVQIPDRLERAIDIISCDIDRKKYVKEGKDLARYISCRHAPKDTVTLTKMAKEVESGILDQMPELQERLKELEEKELSASEEAEIEEIASKVKNKVLTKLRRTTYQWKPINFNREFGLKYLYARIVANYSVIYKCLLEIYKRDKEFIPRSMYNAGSGLGSAVWASHHIWKDKIFQYYCVDPSDDMNTLASLLLQDGNLQSPTSIKNVFFRQFQPSNTTNKFSLTLSAYTLMEQPNRNCRLDIVRSLWDMTDDYLVLIENGTYEGHCLIQEAKSYLLKKSQGYSQACNVFAPCPHNEICPKISVEPYKLACTFSVDYLPLDVDEDVQHEKYSYVILKKGEVTDIGKNWPRLVSQVKKSTKHVNCFMCCPDGTLQHRILTKKRHDRDLYRVARKSLWGDLLPVDWLDKDESFHRKRNKNRKHDNSSKSDDIEDPFSLRKNKSESSVQNQMGFNYNRSESPEHRRANMKDNKFDNPSQEHVDFTYNKFKTPIQNHGNFKYIRSENLSQNSGNYVDEKAENTVPESVDFRYRKSVNSNSTDNS